MRKNAAVAGSMPLQALRRWDAKEVEKDFAALKEHGLTLLRVFPNWRDFQPIVEVPICEQEKKKIYDEDENNSVPFDDRRCCAGGACRRAVKMDFG